MEQKFEEALKRAREIYNAPTATIVVRTWLEQIFPELKESEDERIRKEIIESIKNNMSVVHKKQCLAYLEKQKEQKPLSTEETELNSIAFLEQLGYTCIPPGAEQKPVEIHIDNPNIQKFDPDVKVTTSDSSADGKELLYVSNKSYDIGFRDGVASVKPAEWSEDDEEHINSIFSDFKQGVIPDEEDQEWLKNRLKSLRPKPKQEWSEEDTMHLTNAILSAEKEWGEDSATVAFLKSLRPQPHWKPSEEQMETLLWCTAHLGGADHRVLAELYEHLKMYCL